MESDELVQNGDVKRSDWWVKEMLEDQQVVAFCQLSDGPGL